MGAGTSELTLLTKVTCPNCWHIYAPEESLWVSEHPDLIGDAKLGIDHAKRFLPSRFSIEGDALDEAGYRSTRMACPSCHLEVPRSLCQLPNVFFSILGAPASGKSYFLASMSWRLRQVLPKRFAVSLTDTDPAINARLHQYEETQFLNPDPDKPIALAKTEEQGDMYNTVNMGDHAVILPRPFMFNLQPMPRHPRYSRAARMSRVMSLYDNAGESFLPGADKATSPVTRHLALSKCLMFCFDPTQDPRFRRACEGKSSDPQMTRRSTRLNREASVRQDTILLEAIQRVRRHAGLRDDQLHQRPLIIVVTKWDSWRGLLPDVSHEEPYRVLADQPVDALNLEQIHRASQAVGELLGELCPEIVTAAEGFAQNLLFVPVSATGRSPEVDPDSGVLGIRPRDMAPYWAEVPLVYALHHATHGLVGATYRKAVGNRAGGDRAASHPLSDSKPQSGTGG